MHSHCRRAAAAPAATPTPGRQADADAAAAAQAAPSSSPPRTANSGRRRRRRGLCRRRHRVVVVVRLFPPTSSSNTVRDDPPTPPSLLLSSFVSCVGSLLAHSVLPNPFSSSSLAERKKAASSGGHVVWCHVEPWWCVRSVALSLGPLSTFLCGSWLVQCHTSLPPLRFFGIRCVPVGQYYSLLPPLIAGCPPV